MNIKVIIKTVASYYQANRFIKKLKQKRESVRARLGVLGHVFFVLIFKLTYFRDSMRLRFLIINLRFIGNRFCRLY